MTLFVVLAALMAALAAAAVAVPLCRDRHSRVLGTIAGLVIAAAAAGLYPLWSNWDWHAPPPEPKLAANPAVLDMVAKLEGHLRDDPKDAKGWLMLGRSYLALSKNEDAVVAYDRAHQLDRTNVEAEMGLGEALSLRSGGSISPQAAQLFEQALAQEPDNPQALLYGGFAAAVRGDFKAARARWVALKALNPPPDIEDMIDARLAELPPAGGPAVVDVPTGAAGATGAAATGAAAAGAATVGAEVTVNLTIAPALKAKLTGDAPVFVFAREPGGRGPPLAAKRLTSAAIGTQIHLSAADSMIPGRVLTAGQQVSITARVSFSGQPLPAAGDLFGELTYDVGHDGVRNLVIDRIAD